MAIVTGCGVCPWIEPVTLRQVTALANVAATSHACLLDACSGGNIIKKRNLTKMMEFVFHWN